MTRARLVPRTQTAGRADDLAQGVIELVALDALVGYRRRRLHGIFQDRWRSFFGQLGLAVTPVQGGILLLIERHPGLTQSELARLLRIEAPTLHESVKRLLEGGFVKRESRPADRRTHALDLTAAGHAAVDIIRTRIAEQEAAALAPLSEAERGQLADLIGRVLAARPD